MPRSRILGCPGRESRQAWTAAARAGAAAKILPVRAPLLVGLVVVASSSAFMLWATEGHFVAQVSDLYLVASTRGRSPRDIRFGTTPGEPPSTGATSLLHTVVLALADASGAAARGSSRSRWCWERPSTWRRSCSRPGWRSASRDRAKAAGRHAGRPRRARGLGLPLRLGHRALPVPRPAAARALAGLRGRAGARAWPSRASLLALRRPEGLPVGLALAAGLDAGAARGRARATRCWPWLPRRSRPGRARAVPRRSPARGSARRSRTSRCCRATAPSRRSPPRLSTASTCVRGLLLGLYPPETPIGFARGGAAFFFPPLALVLVLLAVARPEAPLAVPARLWLALVLLIFALTGPTCSWASISTAT